ncbi:galactokinase [Occallatibacter riparius]|uniref:Galactokinase n=1 Tax=Occallatibacter riparius TaxID=1002689 RepID=A0A9J7BSV0_9BACT|nr:galactokinase [Occallatibacter riparius]UWZ85665.1 galactokinase [Occallatibacter riparius]
MYDSAQLRSMHQARFGVDPAIFVAPGRVNIIGEHTDYAEGFVMPAAIDFATLAAISPRTDGKVVIYSQNFDEQSEFDAAALPAERRDHWSDYPLGVMAILAGEGHKIPALSLTLWGDVPVASGLSSSAAIEVSTAIAVLSLIGAEYPMPVLARLCQRSENEFVGSSCGIMDQFISANAAEDHALLLDCRDLSFKLAPIPENVALVIANTMVKHAVTGGEYTSRRAQVEEAAAVIARHRPEVHFLRDANLDDLAKYGSEMSSLALKRARHVITENTRTVAAAEALINHDLKELGRLMAEAHVSYSKDFEASCEEADAMVELAQDLPGLIGARLTGGGFGGCTVNLVERQHAREFSAALGQRYAERTGITPQIHICHASGGAHPVQESIQAVR